MHVISAINTLRGRRMHVTVLTQASQESPAAGLNATDVVSALNKAHAEGQKNAGLDIETGEPKDLTADDITDLHSVKW